MININLLPWREAYREEQKRQFLILLGVSFTLAFIIVISQHFIGAAKINQIRRDNAYLKREIAIFESRVKKIEDYRRQRDKLIERLQIIEQLQRSRAAVVHIFDDFIRAIPEGIHITELRRQQNHIEVEGQAESNTRVSQLMLSLEKSEWLRSPKLDEIKTKKDKNTQKKQGIAFKLRLDEVTPLVQQGRGKDHAG